ncbi:MAG: response regulator [Bacteroidota bacterium]
MDDRTTQPTLQILLVDDSVADRGTFSRLLRRVEGRRYDIAEAETVEAGLERYRSAPPDCAVLDYRLPDESGLYFLQQLAETGEQAPFPVVMVTGTGDERVAVEAIRAGAANYIVKAQFTPTGLAHVIDQAIERVQSHRELSALRKAVMEQNEREIEETEARWRVLANLLSYGVLVVQDGLIRQANDAVASLLGIASPNELIGASWDYRIPPMERGPIREALNSATSALYLRHHVRVADGSLLALNHLAAPILYHERPAHQVLVSLGPLPLANQSGNGSADAPKAWDLTAVGG